MSLAPRLPKADAAPRSLRIAVALTAALAVAGCGANQGSNQTAPGPSTADAPPPAAPAPAPVAAAPAPVYTPPPAVAAAPPPAAPPAAAPAPAPQAAAPAQVAHVVRKGDTVFSLGKRYGVKPAQIQAANGLDANYTIKIGQTLTIPGASGGARPAPAPSVAPTAPAAPAVPSAPPGSLMRPVQGSIVGPFGAISGSAPNEGVDISAQPGAPVLAAADGVVAYISDAANPSGPVLLLQHGGGLITVYARIDQVGVSVGQQVSQGAPIARVAQPRSGPALFHFQLRQGAKPIDPAPYI